MRIKIESYFSCAYLTLSPASSCLWRGRGSQRPPDWVQMHHLRVWFLFGDNLFLLLYILVTFCFWIHFLVFLLKRSSCSHIKAVFCWVFFCSQLLILEDNFSATRRGNALLLLSRVTLPISCVLSPPPKVCLLHLSGSISSIPLCV